MDKKSKVKKHCSEYGFKNYNAQLKTDEILRLKAKAKQYGCSQRKLILLGLDIMDKVDDQKVIFL